VFTVLKKLDRQINRIPDFQEKNSSFDLGKIVKVV
jgi:hypothetical protein